MEEFFANKYTGQSPGGDYTQPEQKEIQDPATYTAEIQPNAEAES
jgi:hypothetical protein